MNEVTHSGTEGNYCHVTFHTSFFVCVFFFFAFLFCLILYSRSSSMESIPYTVTDFGNVEQVSNSHSIFLY